mgnify:CR=1 FL=1
MALQVSYRQSTGVDSPAAYCRVETLLVLSRQRRVEVGVAVYHNAALAAGGMQALERLNYMVANNPLGAYYSKPEPSPAQPDYDDYFDLDLTSARSPAKRLANAAYLYLKARAPLFANALDV